MKNTATMVEVQVDGTRVRMPVGSSVAAALAQQPPGRTRLSVSGQWRAPLCGMGVCQECRVTIDGVAHRLACQTVCAEGMNVVTARGAQ